MREAEVIENPSGLVVVTQDAEGVREALRRQRREKNRSKRQRAAQRRTGGSTGTSTWMPRAKRINRIANRAKPEHPENARLIAKTALKIEADLVGGIEKVIIGQRKGN